MGWISEVFVHKAIAAATINGLSADGRAALLERCGLTLADPVDPSRMVADSAFFELLEAISEGAQDGADVPLEMGASMRCDDYGAFGLAFKSAPDLLGSWRRVERFGRVVTSIANFRVVENGARILMEVIPGHDPRPGLAMTNLLAVSAAMALSREVGEAPFLAETVHLSQERPERTDQYDAHFRCSLVFGAGQDAIEASRTAVLRPNSVGDGGIAAFFDTHLERALAKRPRLDDVSGRVTELIKGHLSEGVPGIGVIAMELGLGSRTLQRRLAEAGTAYQDLVATARHSLAEQLLLRTDYPLIEIAFLTGFSDQSTFTRAFRRRSGQTPAAFRKQV